MTDSLKAAAKAGDIKALEGLMNKSFESKGVTVRVTNSGSLLKIVVRGKSAPDKALLQNIQRGLASVSPRGFDQVIVTARAIGKADAWSHKWNLSEDAQVEPLTKSDNSPPVPKPPVNVLTRSDKSRSWHQKNWLIISLLVLFPPAGIPLVWMSKWPKSSKMCASIFSGLWLLSLFIRQPSETQSRIAQEESPTPTVELAAAEEADSAAPPVEDRTFADAVNQAMAAVEASQKASSKEDWDKVSALWDAAISQMKSVSPENPDYSTAQLKASEYQRNLNYSKQKSKELLPNLNISKAELRSYFSQKGLDFSFEEIPLADGSPRLVGVALDNLVSIELYGSTDLATEAVISTFIGEGIPSGALAARNLAFLNKIAPGYDWEKTLSSSMNELFESKSEESQRISAGNKIVSVKLNEITGTGVYMLLISVKPRI